MQKTRSLILLIAIALAATIAHAEIELHQEHTFTVRPGQTVFIDASFHRIEVKIEPGSVVHAVVDLSASSSSGKAERAIEELAPVFSEKGDTVIIRSTRKGGWNWSAGKIKGKIAVVMPPDLDLSIDSSSGSVTITGASRAMKASEYKLCAENGVTDVTEILLGYDGLSLAVSRATAHDWDLSKEQIYLALAAQVPVEGKWAAQGKTFFVRGGKLDFDIGWVGAVTSRGRVADGRDRHDVDLRPVGHQRADQLRTTRDGRRQQRRRLHQG